MPQAARSCPRRTSSRAGAPRTARLPDAAGNALATLQGKLIALLAPRVAGLEAANAELSSRVARLERAASRNSGKLVNAAER
jgi:hypothetical protein